MINFVYTHSSYADVLDLYLKQANNFNLADIIIASNKTVEGYETVLYDESLTYSERMVQCLDQIKDEIILFCHEDHILFDSPGMNLICYFSKLFLQKEELDFLRLARTGNLYFTDSWSSIINFIDNSSPDIFAVQPTVWRREKLIQFLKKSGSKSIWDLERQGVDNIGTIKGGLHFDGREKQRGGHFDSRLFPCVLTAICKGKWNISEYGEELWEIFKKYDIKTERGFC